MAAVALLTLVEPLEVLEPQTKDMREEIHLLALMLVVEVVEPVRLELQIAEPLVLPEVLEFLHQSPALLLVEVAVVVQEEEHLTREALQQMVVVLEQAVVEPAQMEP